MSADAYWADLGRRAVACDGWRWMPGMLATAPDDPARRLAWRAGGRFYGGIADGDNRVRPDNGAIRHDAIPDLATLGCLLSLVREAHGDWNIYVERGASNKWACLSSSRMSIAPRRDTEAEALLAALESAP